VGTFLRHSVEKLKGYGLCSKTVTWIRIVLQKRQMRESVEAFLKWVKTVKVISGVGIPQGLVLGPLLSLFCENDLANDRKQHENDDTNIYRKIKKTGDSSLLQSDLHSIGRVVR